MQVSRVLSKKVYFGSSPVWTEVLTPHAIKAITPPRPLPGIVEVTLAFKDRQLNKGNPGRFIFTGEESDDASCRVAGSWQTFVLVSLRPSLPSSCMAEELCLTCLSCGSIVD